MTKHERIDQSQYYAEPPITLSSLAKEAAVLAKGDTDLALEIMITRLREDMALWRNLLRDIVHDACFVHIQNNMRSKRLATVRSFLSADRSANETPQPNVAPGDQHSTFAGLKAHAVAQPMKPASSVQQTRTGRERAISQAQVIARALFRFDLNMDGKLALCDATREQVIEKSEDYIKRGQTSVNRGRWLAMIAERLEPGEKVSARLTADDVASLMMDAENAQ